MALGSCNLEEQTGVLEEFWWKERWKDTTLVDDTVWWIGFSETGWSRWALSSLPTLLLYDLPNAYEKKTCWRYVCIPLIALTAHGKFVFLNSTFPHHYIAIFDGDNGISEWQQIGMRVTLPSPNSTGEQQSEIGVEEAYCHSAGNAAFQSIRTEKH